MKVKEIKKFYVGDKVPEGARFVDSHIMHINGVNTEVFYYEVEVEVKDGANEVEKYFSKETNITMRK